MGKFRVWLINLLIGDCSYMKNCTVSGVVDIRQRHNITCCTFVGDSYVKAPQARFPEDPQQTKETKRDE